MSETKVKGIVLKASDSKEKDKLLHLFTIEQGLIVAKIKSVKNENAKLKLLSQPFCVAEFIITSKNDFNTVINGDVIESFYPLCSDYEKFVIACSISQAIRQTLIFLKNEHELIFLEMLKCLKELTYGNSNNLIIYTKFLTELLVLSGYGINLKKCSVCGKEFSDKVFVSSNDSSFVCCDCNSFSQQIVEQMKLKLIGMIKDCDYERLFTIKMNGKVSQSICDLMVDLVQKKLGISLLKLDEFMG